MMFFTVRMIAAASLAALLAVAPASADETAYRNERFGTSASFPSSAFPDPLEEPAEGDGFGWSAPDGANIFIYGRQNGGGETPHSVVAARAAVDEVTYSRSGRSWAVVSGYRDGLIFYERYIFRGELIHSVSIRYPQTQRRTYDPLVGPVTMTLRGPSAS